MLSSHHHVKETHTVHRPRLPRPSPRRNCLCPLLRIILPCHKSCRLPLRARRSHPRQLNTLERFSTWDGRTHSPRPSPDLEVRNHPFKVEKNIRGLSQYDARLVCPTSSARALSYARPPASTCCGRTPARASLLQNITPGFWIPSTTMNTLSSVPT